MGPLPPPPSPPPPPPLLLLLLLLPPGLPAAPAPLRQLPGRPGESRRRCGQVRVGPERRGRRGVSAGRKERVVREGVPGPGGPPPCSPGLGAPGPAPALGEVAGKEASGGSGPAGLSPQERAPRPLRAPGREQWAVDGQTDRPRCQGDERRATTGWALSVAVRWPRGPGAVLVRWRRVRPGPPAPAPGPAPATEAQQQSCPRLSPSLFPAASAQGQLMSLGRRAGAAGSPDLRAASSRKERTGRGGVARGFALPAGPCRCIVSAVHWPLRRKTDPELPGIVP